MHNITSFESACLKKGISTNLPDVSSFPPSLRRMVIALYKLTVIRDAIVGDWKADWNNDDQRKWSPLFWMNKPGFRFHDSDFGISGTLADGGPRLCFETQKQSDYAGQTFTPLYEDLLAVNYAEDLQLQEDSLAIVGQILLGSAPANNLRAMAMDLAIKTLAMPGRTEGGDLFQEADKIYDWLKTAA